MTTSLSSRTAYARRPAMGSLFELWLEGDRDLELGPIAEAALDEVSRLERLLSRFDRASEISRLNREAPQRAVRVDVELLEILQACQAWSQRTEGYFDAGVSDQKASINARERTIELHAASIDMGGYGKGYALDVAASVLRQFGVTSALLHGGTSSVLGMNVETSRENAWPVALRNPFEESTSELATLSLCGEALSSSAVFAAGSDTSDITNPHTGERLQQACACAVIAETAAAAEALSTALLAMGRERAEEFIATGKGAACGARRVAWIENSHEGPSLHWLGEGAVDET